MEILFAVLGIGALVYLANYQQITGRYDGLVKVLLYCLIGAIVYMGFLPLMMRGSAELMPAEAVDEALQGAVDISITAALANLVVALVLAVLALYAIRSLGMRRWIRRFVLWEASKLDNSLSKASVFNPHSIVHTVAVVLALAHIAYLFATFVLIGGVEGMAEALADMPVSVFDLFLSTAAYILVSALGVGLFLRRDMQQFAERLGLRWPTRQDITWGVLGGFGLFVALIFIAGLWEAMVSPEALEQQTAASEQIFAAFSGSLLLGFLLAVSAGVGEEILFRGALQPVFGIILSSLFFSVLHLQYALTPASVEPSIFIEKRSTIMPETE